MPLDAIPEPHLHECVEQVAARHGFENPRFEVHRGSTAGDNYMSLMYRVTVRDETPASRTPLRLMCKCVLQVAARREALKLDRAFRNEASFYRVLDAYGELMRERGLLPPGSCYPEAPRCYLASVEDGGVADMIVLQDMSAEGFSMKSRLRTFDERLAGVVLGALGRLHGTSFALEALQPERFRALRQGVNEQLRDDSRIFAYFHSDLVRQRAIETISERFPEGSKEYQRTMEFCDRSIEELKQLIAPCPEGGNAFVHGDSWTNNILFKDDPQGRRPSVVLLDFQMARYGSPVTDLAHFLYNCTEKDMRDRFLDGMLKEYHAEMQARMRALGVPDPDALFSWATLQEHLKRYSKLGFLLNLVVLPFFLASKDEVPDINADVKKGQENILFKMNATNVLNTRISDTLEEMMAKGYL